MKLLLNSDKRKYIIITVLLLITIICSLYVFEDHKETTFIAYIIVSTCLLLMFNLKINILINQRNQFQNLSIKDSLTNLYNLDYIMKIGSIWTLDSKVAVFILDIDYFKQFNDCYGHLVGNEVLIKVSDLLREFFKMENHLIGRIGGDEFIAIIKDINQERVKEIERNLEKSIRKTYFKTSPNNKQVKINVSFGTVHSDDLKTDDIQELINKADKNMYYNKHVNICCIPKIKGTRIFLPDKFNKLIGLVKEKDIYTYVHSEYTVQFAYWICKELELPQENLRDICLGAWLHDIGKMFIPNDLLRKVSNLTEEEYDHIKEHSQDAISILTRYDVSDTVKNAIKYHHERYDGKGYPFGLKGNDIPLEARIIQVADVFSAITIKKSYAEQMSTQEAIVEMKLNSGTQFDPEIATVFVDVLNKELSNLIKKDSFMEKDKGGLKGCFKDVNIAKI